MIDLRFKEITAENWLIPDKASLGKVRMSKDGKNTKIISSKKWLGEFLKPQLDENVPEEVRRLFEATRGAATYGYFFYPLYALGIGQLFRVAETALSIKCKEIRKSKIRRSFQANIELLLERNILNANRKARWDRIRRLRNRASHPKDQTQLPQGYVLGTLEIIAKEINLLFKPKQK